MKTTFNPRQADLFGARDLWRCSLPQTGLATEDDALGRLTRKVAELTVELANCAKLNADQGRELSRLVDVATAERQKAQQYAREVVDLEGQLREQVNETRRLQRELSRVIAARASACCAIPKATWRLLMQLVHPDKHDGSPASQAAAKWLNENKPD